MASPINNTSQLQPETWVDSYADSLFSYAFFRVQDRGLAEELVQETFVAALAAKERFRGDSSEKTWFFAILKNKIIDQFRKKYREKQQSLEVTPEKINDDFFNEQGEWLVKPGKWRENPQQSFEQREFFAVLQQCLTELSANQNDAFKLREFEDLGSKEICKVLGISSTNYWVLLHRARLVIRKCLEQNWFGHSAAGDTSHENMDV